MRVSAQEDGLLMPTSLSAWTGPPLVSCGPQQCSEWSDTKAPEIGDAVGMSTVCSRTGRLGVGREGMGCWTEGLLSQVLVGLPRAIFMCVAPGAS
jgi:hypothetical protein